MASVEFQKNDTQWLIFADLYQYCQRFWIPEANKQYWQDLVDATDALEEKYKSNKLLCAWMTDFISTKEAEYHEMKGDTYGEDGKTSGTM